MCDTSHSDNIICCQKSKNTNPVQLDARRQTFRFSKNRQPDCSISQRSAAFSLDESVSTCRLCYSQRRLTFPVPGRPVDEEEQLEQISLSVAGTRSFFFVEHNGRRPSYLQRLFSNSISNIDQGLVTVSNDSYHYPFHQRRLSK